MIRLVRAFVVFCWIAAPGVCAAQEAIFVVRHAERADASADSELSPAGEARAARLAAMLKDAGVTRIYTTELKRSIQTVAPLAAALHLTPTVLEADDHKALLAKVRAASPRDRLLIVGHSNTLPKVLAALGVKPAITIADTEYDNLFVVIPRAGAAPRLLRLRY
jgi:broad specificity phosphatase PhoE